MSRFTILPMTTHYLLLLRKILELIDILKSRSEIVIDWFKNSKMMVNPDKFQAILLDKIKVTTQISVLQSTIKIQKWYHL